LSEEIVLRLLLCLSLAFVLTSCSRPLEPSRPAAARDVNIVLVTLDTTRPDYLSCYGGRASTPNLDALAARGVLFTQAVVQVPLTLPSHACILTGSYPQVHGIRDNGGFSLAPGVPTLASLASEAGMDTAAFVGAAILNRRHGLDLGFRTYSDDMKEQEQSSKLPGVVAEIPAREVSNRAIAWLQSKASQAGADGPERPFFLWLHYYDPHVPYDPPQPERTLYADDPYAGELAYTDGQLGRVFDWLRSNGQEANTLIVVMADHGESLGEHGEYTHGVFLYDSTVHVPLIIAGPGVPGGKTATQQVRSIDILPTVTEYLGIPDGGRSQGTSLLPLLTSGRPVRTTYSYMETLYPKTAMGWSELRGVRDGAWKLILAPRSELYDLTADRAESRNVIGEFGPEAERLKKRAWDVGGDPDELGSLQASPLDDRTRRELESLGYVNVSRPREIRIDMSGPDPKDRVRVLEVAEKTADLVNHDQYKAAVPLLLPAIKSDPQNPMLYSRLALCYERTGQYRKAIEVYGDAIRHQADNDYTYSELGELYVRVGDLSKAVAAMERASQLNPSNLQNLTNLATAYLQLGRPAEAEKAAAAVLAHNPQDAGASNLLGLIAVSRGDGNQARVQFEKALRNDPDFADAYLNLGVLAEKAGQPQLAANYFRQFLAKASKEKHAELMPKVAQAIADLEGNAGGS
jgi:choline-sulfatase